MHNQTLTASAGPGGWCALEYGHTLPKDVAQQTGNHIAAISMEMGDAFYCPHVKMYHVALSS